MKMKTLGSLLLGAPILFAQPEIEEGEPEPTKKDSPAFFQTFENAQDEPRWSNVNDGVMGGLSQGGAEMAAGTMVFAGTLSLENNGGFSSIRTSSGPWNLTGAEGMKMRVMGDGRTYKLRLSTDAQLRGGRVAYQGGFETKKGEWTEVTVPFANLGPSYRGRELEGPPLNLAEVTEIGFILADGKEGNFSLEVDWLKTYSAEEATDSPEPAETTEE